MLRYAFEGLYAQWLYMYVKVCSRLTITDLFRSIQCSIGDYELYHPAGGRSPR